jgi:4-alpha-glucanotransferase
MKKESIKRKGGVLMPISALPSDCGIGTLGQGAYDFVDWLQSAGMTIWQVLPLLPTGYGDSPYQSCSSVAVNPYFIDFDLLVKDGLLEKSDYQDLTWQDEERRVDYGRQFSQKREVLKKAFHQFDKTTTAWRAFLKEGKYADYALFMALKTKFSYAPWMEWPKAYADGDEAVIEAFKAEYKTEIEFWQFTQYLFLRQWKALLSYAHAKGVLIMGDMPIYLSEDSVETWKQRDKLFALDKKGNLSLRAGVPPDAFSEEGQFWGNPVYDWEKHEETGYAWWKERIEYTFTLFDLVRIDHFRAFDRFFAIPAEAESAKEGEWMDGPKAALFQALGKEYPIIAEDLGVIDEGVIQLMNDTGYPGMKVFEFAFDGNDENEYLPSNYVTDNCVAYTGTHDNETLRSFLENMDVAQRKAFEKRLEEECLKADVAYLTETVEEECKTIIELLYASKAAYVIVPMQDVLCMGEEARLNAPSTVSMQNWTFRFTQDDFRRRKAAWLKELAEKYNR